MSPEIAPLATVTGGGPDPVEVPLPSRAVVLPRSPRIWVGVGIMVFFIIFAIVGPFIRPYNPNYIDQAWVSVTCSTGPGTCIGQTKDGVAGTTVPLVQPYGPSGAHPLGTTVLGSDVWSQLLSSTGPTLIVAFLAALIATLLSVVVGVSAGYLGGNADEGLSLFSNVFLAIPGLPLLIVLASYVPGADTSAVVVGLIVALTGWAYGARVLRAQTLSLRNRDFVEAARVSGEGRLRIILVEVVPNLLPIIASSFLFTTLYAIGAYIALAFLGLAGAPNASPAGPWNWGIMIQQAYTQSAINSGWWWWWVPPGIAIALVGTALALMNFGIDEFVNPRLRAAGLTRRAARQAGISVRPTLGFTEVVRRGEAPAAAAAAVPAGGGGPS